MPLAPAPIVDNNLVLCSVHLSHATNPRISVVTFATVDDTAVGAQASANAVCTAWNTDIMPNVDADVTNIGVSVVYGTGTRVSGIAASTNAPVAGGTVQNSVPPNVSVLVKKATAFAGRQNRGRLFMPWYVDVTHVDEAGVILAATVTALNTQWAAFLGGLTAASQTPVIANKAFITVGTKRQVDAIHTGHQVTSFTVEGLVATQRRRLGR